ncbi:NACHT domain-containing protein [Bosea sp. (in: a-proteobacteria)]|uniref:NACHT domain-containing protein n=1 Tax=Bosea sp. (in: a-proteobacteria) TaxID=1871050 RepID=UPI002732D881|nr:NACHT domain-containing protein [Bosea sp. (in: a-proteobacteria)]MDP3408558.1 NACHT domain-containing protein [Bosea sp. (in: a-proteobacteria)]
MAGNKTIKYSAITRAGYEYQDLVGIDLLIRHYRDPELFEWVQLESDDPNVKALDDVVAKRKDGSVEYVQVKFTVNAEEYALDWDYLLSKKENGTSMLAKWAKSLARAKTNGPIHSAQLKTNRVPTPAFSACLNGSFVDLAKVDADVLIRLEAECGGRAMMEAFFETFSFNSSLPNLDQLELSLRDRIVPTDTDLFGWLLLRNEVTRWAILQREPPPDGRILRDHVVRLISRKRPRPISQEYFVPDDYAPPSSSFDEAFRTRIVDETTPLTIMWGTPGRGKSTYLSYLTRELQSQGNAVLRHHYFISSESSSANRASYTDIAVSLYDQLFSRYPEFTAGVTDDTENLRLGLGIAAENLAREGKRLYLFVDGLDHVYRDTHRTDQLNHLFNVLFPLPDNLSLIVGTQRVADDRLPSKLLINAKDDDWIEIPRMDEVAVRRWLERQDRARPLNLRWSGRRAEEVDKIGTALFQISHGHPLHLIYAFESLVRSGKPLDNDAVLALPQCPDGDIRTYYQSLWLRISEPSRNILHMLAGSDFFWPSSGIRACIGEYGEVSFLLEPHNSGMMPFHGSIFAWVRERADHEERYAALLPRIVHWLDKEAPDYWRWGWLWLMQAAAGNTAPLLGGTTREWAVDSLASGWPESQIQDILSAAERLTFQNVDLPATVRLRAIKTRVSNVREYQAWDFGPFRGAALAVADNRQQAINLLDALGHLTNDELSALARHGPEALRSDLVEGCYAELGRRINTWIVLRHRPVDDFTKLSHAFLDVAALGGKERVVRIMAFLNGYRQPSAHIIRYVELLAKVHDIEALEAVENSLKGSKWIDQRRIIQQHILRAALFLGADPLQRLKRGKFNHLPFAAAWLSHKAPSVRSSAFVPPLPTNLTRERSSPADSVDMHNFFVDSFWIAVRANILAEGPFSLIYPGLVRGDLGFIDTVLDCIESCAADLISGRIPWTYSTPFLAAADIASVSFTGRNDTEQALYFAFKKLLTSIALDIHLIGLPDKNVVGISADEFAIARASVHWVDELLIEANVENRIPYLSAEAAKCLLDDLSKDLASKVSEFNERAEQWTKYASLSHLYGFGNAGALIRRAASCLIGYGHRKDTFAFEVLDSIEEVHRVDPGKTAEWISKITPIVDCITDFTDGDETRHARSELIELVSYALPHLLPKFYEHHLDGDEWYYANQCLENFIKFSELDSREFEALIGTLVDQATLDELAKRAADKPDAQALLAKQIAFLGGSAAPTKREHSTPDRDLTEEEINITRQDPTLFGPDDFSGIAKTVGRPHFHYSQKKNFIERWLRYWHAKKKSRQAIASVKSYFESDNMTYHVEECLDTVFEISLESEGRDSAYHWLVMGHIRRHGWASYFTSKEEVEARLENAARVYPERWKDFIRDTSTPLDFYARRGHGFSIGFRHLVRFLLAVGQTALAQDVTSEFVSTLIAETKDQPIEEATWLR